MQRTEKVPFYDRRLLLKNEEKEISRGIFEKQNSEFMLASLKYSAFKRKTMIEKATIS